MKIMIGVSTAGYLRNSSFLEYYAAIQRPVNSLGAFVHGQSPARGRNHLFQLAIQQECTHILLLDDDVCPPPDIIEKLIRHDKDIVTGVLLKRDFPHHPILGYVTDKTGKWGVQFLNNLPGDGLLPIKTCGLGCVLIKTSVLKTLEPLNVTQLDESAPPAWVTLGNPVPDHWCDDTMFFRRCEELGIEMFADLSVPVGHMGQVIIWPKFEDGRWLTSYDVGGKDNIKFFAVQPDPSLVSQ